MQFPALVALFLAAGGDAPPPSWPAAFGRLHLLVLHFPIALLITALALDLPRRRARTPAPSDGVAIMVWLGAASAVVATAMGLVYAAYDDVHGPLIKLHRNLGLAATGVALVAAALAWHARRAPTAARSWAFRLSLAAAVALVAFGAHQGGESVHGEGYLWEVVPGHASAPPADAADAKPAAGADAK